MKTLFELKQEFSNLKQKRISRAEKVPIANSIRAEIGNLEQAAAQDFSYPLSEIREMKSFLKDVDDYLR